MTVVEEPSKEIGGGGGGSSYEGGLEGAAEPACAYELSFDGPEEGEGDEGDDDGELEGCDAIVEEHVGE